MIRKNLQKAEATQLKETKKQTSKKKKTIKKIYGSNISFNINTVSKAAKLNSKPTVFRNLLSPFSSG